MSEVLQLIDARETLAPSQRISDFLTTNFSFENTPHPNYPEEVLNMLATRPDRLNNPNYVNFYLRVMQIAAEYGFPSASAHLTKRLPRDPMHPLTLLALGGYLSDVTLQSTIQRQGAEDYWNNQTKGQLSHEERRKIWATWISPSMGTVELPQPVDFLDPTQVRPWEANQGTRLTYGLPLYQPDTEFHFSLREVAPKMSEVESMQREGFDTKMFGVARTFYRYGINTLPVFNNPQEWA